VSRRGHPILLVGLAVGLMLLAVWAAPHISRSGLERARLDLHWPRALLGAVAGFGLAASGVVLQAVLRNPLASPYVLGISSGASVGALAAIQLGLGAVTLAPDGAAQPLADALQVAPVPLGALLGALATAGLVYAVASTRQLASETLLLAGVAAALFGGAVVSLLHHLATTIDLRDMIRWSLGSLDVVGMHHVYATGALVAIGCGFLLAVARQLDVASLDDDSARGLGVDPVVVRRLAFVGTSIVTAGVVAFAGPIGFVGLVVPHAVRPFTGPDPRVLLPCAACVGAAFLIGCDVLARTLTYPMNLPINVITSAFGCPAFVWILVRRRGAR
jgi:iron complex transport system permease protein